MTRHELHRDAFLGYHPVLVGQVAIELPQHRLGRTDGVFRSTIPQEREVIVVVCPPVHAPDTVQGTVITLQRLDDALQVARIFLRDLAQSLGGAGSAGTAPFHEPDDLLQPGKFSTRHVSHP